MYMNSCPRKGSSQAPAIVGEERKISTWSPEPIEFVPARRLLPGDGPPAALAEWVGLPPSRSQGWLTGDVVRPGALVCCRGILGAARQIGRLALAEHVTQSKKAAPPPRPTITTVTLYSTNILLLLIAWWQLLDGDRTLLTVASGATANQDHAWARRGGQCQHASVV